MVVAAGVLSRGLAHRHTSILLPPCAGSLEDRGVENSREGVGAAGHGLAAAVAVPDAPRLTLDGVAPAEGAGGSS